MAQEESGPDGPRGLTDGTPAVAHPLRVALRTTLSIAIGGASGAIVNFLTEANGDVSKIDWHKLGITALVGAIVTVCTHYMKPPNK